MLSFLRRLYHNSHLLKVFFYFCQSISIDTFNKIEDLLENHILAQIIKDSTKDESYDIHKAKAYYKQLTEKK